MKLNVYSVRDVTAGIEKRIAFANTHGSLVRDNLKFDLYNQQNNPNGIPFDDLQYVFIANYDTETGQFENVEHHAIDILKSYNFKMENQATRETPSQESIDKSVDK